MPRLHTLVYVIDRGTLDRIIDALPHTDIWTGWLAMLIFVPLAITSNNAAQRWLHAGWKTLQRLAYPAAVLVLIHWAALHNWGSWPPAAVHFGPLVGAVGLSAVVLVPAAARPGCNRVNAEPGPQDHPCGPLSFRHRALLLQRGQNFLQKVNFRSDQRALQAPRLSSA